MAFFSSIGAAIFGAGTFLAAAATAVLKLAVGVGLNLLAQSLAGKPKGPEFSINGQLQGGGDLPRTIIMGKYSTAGSLVWANTWGKHEDTQNANLTQVIALADLPVKGLTGIFVNGERCTIDWNTTDQYRRGHPITQYRKDGQDNLWIHFYDGTQTDADYLLTTWASNGNRSWGANRVGRGVAYVVITSLVAKQMFSGIPTFMFEVDGSRLYDVSRDSSRGGVGNQRIVDPSTWGGDGDDLPAVQMYNILMGIKYNNRWLYGFQGVQQARLPDENWIAQINKCRQQVSSATGTETQYRSAVELPVDVASSGAFDALLTACQGRISDVGGSLYLYCGEPEAPQVAFTDGDLISTVGQSFTPFFGLADTVNGISAKYPSPADGWAIKTAPPLYRTDLEIKHGGRRLMADVELTAVPYAEQVQRLMRSSLLEAQRARRHTITLPPKFWPYAVPGATISWTSERNGYVNKLFRIDGAIDGANLEVMIDITEVDPSDYNWNSETDFTPPVDGQLGPMRPAPQPIIGFGAVPDVAKDSNGNNRRCAIRLFWDGSLAAIDFVDYEIRLASDLSVIDAGRAVDFTRGSLLIAPGTLLPNEVYQVRAIYGTYDGNSPFVWSSWIPVTTLDIRLGPLDIYPIDVEDLNKDIYEMMKWQFDALRYTQEELDRQGKIMADGMSGNFVDRQQIRRELSSTAGSITANYKEAIIVATGPNSALAQRIEQVEVKIDTDVANAVQTLNAEITRVDGEVQAVADATQALSVNVGKFSANGLFRTTVEVTPAGAASRIGLSVAASDSASTSTAAIFLDAIAGGQSRVVVNADQFVVTNGTDSKVPLIFSGGTLYANELRVKWANIDEVKIGTAQIDDAAITAAKIGDLQVKTSNLDFNQVTQSYRSDVSVPGGGAIAQNQWVDVLVLSTNNPQANTSFCECRFYGTAAASTGSVDSMLRFINKSTGEVFMQRNHNAQTAYIDLSGLFIDSNSVAGNNQYAIQVNRSGGGLVTWLPSSGLIKALIWKR